MDIVLTCCYFRVQRFNAEGNSAQQVAGGYSALPGGLRAWGLPLWLIAGVERLAFQLLVVRCWEHACWSFSAGNSSLVSGAALQFGNRRAVSRVWRIQHIVACFTGVGLHLLLDLRGSRGLALRRLIFAP